MMTPYSLVVQLARLVPAPPKHGRGRHLHSTDPWHERVGRCPSCGEFVRIKFEGPKERGAPCPQCGLRIASLDPLWPTLPERSARTPRTDAKPTRGSAPATGFGGDMVGRFLGRFRSALGLGPSAGDQPRSSSTSGVWDADLDGSAQDIGNDQARVKSGVDPIWQAGRR